MPAFALSQTIRLRERGGSMGRGIPNAQSREDKTAQFRTITDGARECFEARDEAEFEATPPYPSLIIKERRDGAADGRRVV